MPENIRDAVRQKYAEAITNKQSCCSASSCSCESAPLNECADLITSDLYTAEDVHNIPAEALAASFGCGNPTALAQLKAGEVVLDLGSGAGLDVLLSAKRVGPAGYAYGLDMTDEMLQESQKNKAKSGLTNVEFLKGYLEDIPLPDNTVDVIISNCVINLSADKDVVLKEAFRVLKPGGRFAVSDIVLTRPLPPEIQEDLLSWAGCVAGALLKEEYLEKLSRAGFINPEVEITRVYDLTDERASSLLSGFSLQKRQELNGAVVSAFIRGVKPQE